MAAGSDVPVNTSLTEIQWDLICFCEQFWHEYKAFPSYQEIISNVDGISNTKQVESELYSHTVQIRLSNRGIDPGTTVTEEGPKAKNPSRLTDKQIATIMLLLNPLDKRSQGKKLEDLGVSSTTYQGWMKQKRFADFFKARSEELFGEGLPLVHSALLDRASSGDMRAIKLFYEVSGRHTGVQSEEIANVRLLIVRLIEVLHRHLDDNTMRIVSREIQQLMFNPSSNMQAPLDGLPVYKEETNGSDSEIGFI